MSLYQIRLSDPQVAIAGYDKSDANDRHLLPLRRGPDWREYVVTLEDLRRLQCAAQFRAHGQTPVAQAAREILQQVARVLNCDRRGIPTRQL